MLISLNAVVGTFFFVDKFFLINFLFTQNIIILNILQTPSFSLFRAISFIATFSPVSIQTALYTVLQICDSILFIFINFIC